RNGSWWPAPRASTGGPGGRPMAICYIFFPRATTTPASGHSGWTRQRKGRAESPWPSATFTKHDARWVGPLLLVPQWEAGGSSSHSASRVETSGWRNPRPLNGRSTAQRFSARSNSPVPGLTTTDFVYREEDVRQEPLRRASDGLNVAVGFNPGRGGEAFPPASAPVSL